MIAILEKPAIVKELRAQNERIEAKVCEIVAENERLRFDMKDIEILSDRFEHVDPSVKSIHKIAKAALGEDDE